jgi:predicted chitinase
MIPKQGERSEKEVSGQTENFLSSLVNKFKPANVGKMFSGGMANIADKFKGSKREKKESLKAKNPYFTSVSASNLQDVKVGDTLSDTFAKLYSLVKKEKEYDIKQSELKMDFAGGEELKDKKKHDELIDAFKKLQSKSEKKEQKKIEKDIEKETKKAEKEQKKLQSTDKPTGTTPSTPSGSKPTATTPAPKTEAKPPPKTETPTSKPAPKPTAEPAPKPTGKTAEPAPKPTAEPAPKTEAKPPPKAETQKPSAQPIKAPTSGSNTGKKALITAMAAAGYSQAAQNNILANVQQESNFTPQTENLGKYTGSNLYKMYGPEDGKFTDDKGNELISNPKNSKGKHNTVRFNSLQEANDLVKKGPSAVAEFIYGGRMGNTKPGDAFKYIGRGYIQLTGKENYEKVGNLIGVDLVNNPELANDPEIAAKIVPAFFQVTKRKPKDLENIDETISAVGSADAKSTTERKKLASEYQSQNLAGQILSDASTENKELKKTSGNPTPVIVDQRSNNTVNGGNQNSQHVQTTDDTPVMLKQKGR